MEDVGRGYDPNPNKLPAFMDYYIQSVNGKDHIQTACIDVSTEVEDRSKYESAEGFIRWMNSKDMNMSIVYKP